MITPTYPGVYVREEASGARAIAAAATSIAAFVGMTQRGPLLEPVRVFNLADFERSFGAGNGAGQMQPQVQLFFNNGGGQAWITRIAKDSAPADITLANEAQTDTLKLTAVEDGVDGNLLRAEVSYDTTSPEERFNLRIYRRVVDAAGTVEEADAETFVNLSMNPDDGQYVEKVVNGVSNLVEVAAVGGPQVALLSSSTLYSGLILPSAVGDAANTVRARTFGAAGTGGTATFKLRYNGRPAVNVVVNIAAGDSISAILSSIATAMEGALLLDGISQTVTGNQINTGTLRQITLEMAGASFDIRPGDSNDLAASLMLSQEQGAVYIDQFSANRPAPTGFTTHIHTSATGDNLARLLNFAGEAKTDIARWEITDASPAGSPGLQAITYPEPTASMITGTAFVPDGAAGDLSQGSMSNVQENLDAIADAINGDTNKRWKASAYGHRIVMTPLFDNTSDADLSAALTTEDASGGGTGTDLGGGTNIFNTASKPVNVKAYTLGRNSSGVGGGVYQDRGAATDGDDGLLPEEEQYRDAFAIMDEQVDLFNLMILPRATAQDGVQSDGARKTAFNAASAFCAKKRAFLLADPPSTDPALRWTDSSSAETGVNAFRTGIDTRNSAVFWPRLKMADNTYQDPAGPMAGLMARIDGSRGVWKAAAGLEATLRGITGVEYPMSDDQNGVINPRALNALRVFPAGVVSWGARTLVGFDGSGNIDDKYISVRRTMLFIEESLYRGLKFAVFEPNDEPLWAQIRLAAGSFMNTLFRQGAFAGQKASDAYFVICDKTTTTLTDINLGIVNVVVAFAPLKPAEFVILTVKQIAGQAQI
jgi:Bacteriophage tail sheath protein